MKKKLLLAALVAAMAFVLYGCAQTISGDVETVVEEAQDLSTNDSANAEVSGYVAYGLDAEAGENQIVLLKSSEMSTDDYFVTLYFDSLSEEDANELNSGRVTVTGEIKTDMIDSDHITLDNCKVK